MFLSLLKGLRFVFLLIFVQLNRYALRLELVRKLCEVSVIVSCKYDVNEIPIHKLLLRKFAKFGKYFEHLAKKLRDLYNMRANLF